MSFNCVDWVNKHKDELAFDKRKIFEIDTEEAKLIFTTTVDFAIEHTENNFPELLSEIEIFMGIEVSQSLIGKQEERVSEFTEKIRYWLLKLIDDTKQPSKRRGILRYMNFINHEEALVVIKDRRVICCPIAHALMETMIRMVDIGISKNQYNKYHIKEAIKYKDRNKIHLYRQQVNSVDNIKTASSLFLKALEKYGANPSSTLRHFGDLQNISIKRINKTITALPTIGWL